MLRLDIRLGMAVAVMVLAMAWPAGAQRLLETDGIELRGSVRVVTFAAGTCNVVEASHTAAEYERIQANHGQPLDVWRLDFSVRNGSGRWLDHLIARYGIESAWPDCTNWSGPDDVQLRELNPEVPLEDMTVGWSGTTGFIQETGRNVVAPDATLTDTAFILVLQGDPPPRFANWSVDFNFGETPSGSASAAEPAASTGTPAASPQATPEQETVFWQSIMNSTNPAEFEAYLEQFPNGVFRLLAEARLAALRASARDAPAVGGPRGGVASASTASAQPAADQDAPPRSGETRVFDGMQFVWVPAGEFRMGSTSAEAFDNEQPVTQVRISRGFWLGQHEVTQAEWQGVMGTNPSNFSGCGQCPVEEVSWNDAQEFIGRLNGRAGGNRYRLPTEAEWEYAARAGTTGDRYGNLDASAWYGGNSGKRTHPVGQKAPNAWGLHDMLGNVWEWAADWYDDYPGGSVTDPKGPGSGSERVARGGGWSYLSIRERSSLRFRDRPGLRLYFLGFRLLRTG